MWYNYIMKKTLSILIILLGIFIPNLSSVQAWNTDWTVTENETDVFLSRGGSPSCFRWWNGDAETATWYEADTSSHTVSKSSLSAGTWTFIIQANGNCEYFAGFPFSTFAESWNNYDTGYGTITISEPEPEPEPVGVFGFGTMLENADQGFASTTGTTVGASVAWVGDTFIKLFMGSGLALLIELRYWILALIILSCALYFSYRAMQFYKK